MYGVERCVFFTKMGACRHGDGCTKVHLRPTASPTVLFPMMYPNPMAVVYVPERRGTVLQYDKRYLRKHFEHFYKEVWRTFMEFGRIAELRVVSNLGEHLLGNVYIRFHDPDVALRITKELRAKKLNEIIVLPELSPVTNFAEACCKEDLEGACARGAQCNYLHIMKVSRRLMEKLEKEQHKYWKKRERAVTGGGGGGNNDGSSNKDRKRERSRTPSRSRDDHAATAAAAAAAAATTASDVCQVCGKPGHAPSECPLK